MLKRSVSSGDSSNDTAVSVILLGRLNRHCAQFWKPTKSLAQYKK